MRCDLICCPHRAHNKHDRCRYLRQSCWYNLIDRRRRFFPFLLFLANSFEHSMWCGWWHTLKLNDFCFFPSLGWNEDKEREKNEREMRWKTLIACTIRTELSYCAGLTACRWWYVREIFAVWWICVLPCCLGRLRCHRRRHRHGWTQYFGDVLRWTFSASCVHAQCSANPISSDL